ncbi:MAG TPA: cyclic nucleotide-binding domain-containing protein [Terracidiphilus sp.]|nr:cyclic nucleotide-binding domain-containing protein [Terracidiphilus sp.]
MQSSAGPGPDRRAALPLSQLMDCPPATARVLNAAAKYVEFSVGETIFRQGTRCEGLYVIVSGQLLRRAERLQTRLVLGSVHAGEIVELAAALGDGLHTYTLTAQANGSLMALPLQALEDAFRGYPALRMQLLAELAREVSRAYVSCCASRMMGLRRRPGNASTARA